MKNPQVSIIITTKNSASTLEILLSSIKKQDYTNKEIIVVDNFSTDNTSIIARRWTDKVYKKGPERSVQRNYGVSKASGKYVLILDSDMELTQGVITSCVSHIRENKALIIPEKTVGDNLLARVRAFEREMYMGDATVEVARFFERKVFEEFGGYDENLTGAEDYDLPKRISSKYKIDWASKYILHHEENLTLGLLLRKKYYYAFRSASYASKHPDMIILQGNLLFRKAYLRSWRRFVSNPLLGLLFIFVRILELLAAMLGYIKAVGFGGFIKTIGMSIKA